MHTFYMYVCMYGNIYRCMYGNGYRKKRRERERERGGYAVEYVYDMHTHVARICILYVRIHCDRMKRDLVY